jgi:hypothetical protein
VIKSREDLTASGIDGISSRIMKGAGAEWLKFVKNIVRASLWSGRVRSPWKEASTILTDQRGERDEIENWGRSRLRIVWMKFSRVWWPERFSGSIRKYTSPRTARRALWKRRIDAANTASLWTSYYRAFHFEVSISAPRLDLGSKSQQILTLARARSIWDFQPLGVKARAMAVDFSDALDFKPVR